MSEGAPVRRVLLALGSNLGDRATYLRAAVDALAASGELVAVSPVYETDPVGGPDGQGAYLNMVVALRTADAPAAVLERARSLERAAERVREVRWGPRTLDVDVLWIDGERIATDELEVPHPRMFERPFVLAPLEDVAPDLVDDGWSTRFEHLGVWRLGPLDGISAGSP
jgi:2-amino-4-hydroxy-6-hydroxymethyldihydropteridine diphosphokinase